MATVQVLSKVLHPAGLPQHKFTMPTFWVEDPVGWFQHAEAEFTLTQIWSFTVSYLNMENYQHDM
jgi:hypothetical protein